MDSVDNAAPGWMLQLKSSFTALPEASSSWTHLTELDMRGCSSLTVLPEASSSWTQLTTLYLMDCTSLTALPEASSSWSKLDAHSKENPLFNHSDKGARAENNF